MMDAVYWGMGLLVVNILTFGLFALDKYRAIRRGWRVPEKVLLGLSVLGGAGGGLAAMVLCRHKTAHWYFWSVLLLAAAAWCCLILKRFL